MGEGRRFLWADYSVDCEADWFTMIYEPFVLPIFMIWPLGLPSLLFLQMFKARKLILAGDADTLVQFGFVLDDYKRTHWYVAHTFQIVWNVRLQDLR